MKKSAIIYLVGVGFTLGACGNGTNDGSGTSLEAGISVSETGTNSMDTNEGVDGNDDDGNTTTNQKWDVLEVPDAAFNCGAGGGNDDPEYSYLWAANSTQGTISKLDTKTVTELGRYIVRPDSQGSPSRTSVSLSGHVAVANRNGGVTKVYAQEEECQESNGMPGIQTSV